MNAVLEAPNSLEVRKEIRAKIYALQDSLESSVESKNLKEENGKLTNYFTKGIYARELFIPAGTAMVSKLHKLPRLCIISQGRVRYTTEFEEKIVQAPFTAVFKPGSKVALYAFTDVVWTAIHGTDETDLDKLEDILIAKNHEEYDAFCENFLLEEKT